MKTEKQIEKKVYKAYCQHGQSSAFDEANKHKLINYEYCNVCETESPEIDHICLICGQDTNFNPKSNL